MKFTWWFKARKGKLLLPFIEWKNPDWHWMLRHLLLYHEYIWRYLNPKKQTPATKPKQMGALPIFIFSLGPCQLPACGWWHHRSRDPGFEFKPINSVHPLGTNTTSHEQVSTCFLPLAPLASAHLRSLCRSFWNGKRSTAHVRKTNPEEQLAGKGK